MSDLIGKLFANNERKIKPRKTRRQKATKSVRKDLNKRLGAHDRWTKMANEPMFAKSIGRWEKLRNELRSREVDMGDIGGLYIQDKMEEQGFARRLFKVTEVKR
jgi:hypothetical protein